LKSLHSIVKGGKSKRRKESGGGKTVSEKKFVNGSEARNSTKKLGTGKNQKVTRVRSGKGGYENGGTQKEYGRRKGGPSQ